MYNIGEIFYLDEDYTKRAEYCNANGLVINEIDKDEKGRRFQIAEPRKPSSTEILNNEMETLKRKLEAMDYKTSKYVDGEYTVEEWSQIIQERKNIRNRIRELEVLLIKN